MLHERVVTSNNEKFSQAKSKLSLFVWTHSLQSCVFLASFVACVQTAKSNQLLALDPTTCFMSSHRRANWTSGGIIRWLDESASAFWLHQQTPFFSRLLCRSWRGAVAAGDTTCTGNFICCLVTPKHSHCSRPFTQLRQSRKSIVPSVGFFQCNASSSKLLRCYVWQKY